MEILEAFFLGTFQGVLEFLPVSSSGHLLLLEKFLGYSEEKLLLFDAFLHGGSFVALCFLFWREIWSLRRDYRLLGLLLLASVPAGIAGLLFKDTMDVFRTLPVVGASFLISAVFFFVAEYFFQKIPVSGKVNARSTLAVGLMQIFALVPGISRSGTAAATQLFFGIPRHEAIRFSFFCGLPLLGGVLLLSAYDALTTGFFGISPLAAAVAFLSSTVVSYITARFLLLLFQRISFLWFGGYLVVIGLVCLLF